MLKTNKHKYSNSSFNRNRQKSMMNTKNLFSRDRQKLIMNTKNFICCFSRSEKCVKIRKFRSSLPIKKNNWLKHELSVKFLFNMNRSNKYFFFAWFEAIYAVTNLFEQIYSFWRMLYVFEQIVIVHKIIQRKYIFFFRLFIRLIYDDVIYVCMFVFRKILQSSLHLIFFDAV